MAMATNNSSQATKRGFLPKPRGWVVILAAFTFGAAYLYYLYREQQDIFINTYHFRTLQEVATEFNNNLDQLVSLHKYGESDSTILSIFASYQKDETDPAGKQGHCKPEPPVASDTVERISGQGNKEKSDGSEGSSAAAAEETTPAAGDDHPCQANAGLPAAIAAYSLGANRVKITRENGDIYHVAVEDLVPAPRNDFVIYVIADENNRVLSSSGGSSGLSLIDTKQISKAIQLRDNQDWLKLASRESQAEPDPEVPLPGYSTRIDVDLTTGTSRLFILPFHLHHKVAVASGNGPADAGLRNEGVPLYLVGIQPENVVKSFENKRWNLSLLLLSLVGLVFLWTVTRLLMISPHQPLGGSFYYTTIAASYLTFLMLVALLLSLGHRNGETAGKQDHARGIIHQAQAGLEQDLYSIFQALDDYHGFYNKLLDFGDPAPADQPGGAAMDYSANMEANCADSQIWSQGTKIKALVATDGSKSSEPEKSGEGKESPANVRQNQDAPPHYQESAQLQYYEGNDVHQFIRAIAAPKLPLWRTKRLPPFSLINLYPPTTEIDLVTQDNGELKTQEWLRLPKVDTLPAGGKLLSVFLMNEDARQVLPIHYYQESNKPPASYTLAHRDYFRRVRDRAGLDVTLRQSLGDDQPGIPRFMPCDDRGIGVEEPGAAGVCIRQNNLYIQRLLNINTGTRGTTLGVPLRTGCGSASVASGDGHILGADIVLSSLSLTEWNDRETLEDMVFMVVDRVSGQVLYHTDSKRSMVENLYHAGRGTSGISRSIRAGRTRNQVIPGYYHGESGDFIADSLPIGQWIVVVFIPDASAGSLMTNTFLASLGVMSAVLLLLAAFLYALRRFRDTDDLKVSLGLPMAVNHHSLMLFGSILVATIYFGDTLGRVINQPLGESGQQTLALTLSLLAMVVVLLWGYATLSRLRKTEPHSDATAFTANRGTAALLLVYVIVGAGMAYHLRHVAGNPAGALSWYYENLYLARLNQEHQELSEIALTRYPNTIKQHARDPLNLLPVSQAWRDKLNEPCVYGRSGSRDRQWEVLPDHIGTFSQYTASATPYDWVMRYLLGIANHQTDQRCRFSTLPEDTEASNGVGMVPDDTYSEKPAGEEDPQSTQDSPTDPDSASATASPGFSAVARFTVLITAAFALLCWLWLLFHRWIIGLQLAGTRGLIEHLRHIVNRNLPERTYAPRPHLFLDLHCERSAGDDLTALLLRYRNFQPATESGRGDPLQRETNQLNRRGIALLLSECEWLQPEPKEPDALPGVNIRFAAVGEETPGRPGGSAGRGLLSLQLSELDVCLSRADSRSCLLKLIRQLKAMTLAGDWADLGINLGFHSYEALLLKAHNMESDRDPISESERAGWAELLMDFTVDLPEDLTAKLDPAFVLYECEGSQLLQDLPDELPGKDAGPTASWAQRRRWLLLSDAEKNGSEWASINCILLKAGALYRHKWETCSSAEKLALYYLSRKKRINAANAQLLEQLALQGLIRVDHDRIRILNNSFAYFARHAEDTATLKDLVQIGEAGAWMEYRLPVTLVILLLLGGIAITSGSSLYLIVASVLGLLGTIGSLTSSAQMIRQNLR
jgi:hypothetical protein